MIQEELAYLSYMGGEDDEDGDVEELTRDVGVQVGCSRCFNCFDCTLRVL